MYAVAQTCDADENAAFIKACRKNGDLYEENITSHIWKIFCGCHGNHFTGVMAVCRIVAAQLQVHVCQFACACDSNHCCAYNRQ